MLNGKYFESLTVLYCFSFNFTSNNNMNSFKT